MFGGGGGGGATGLLNKGGGSNRLPGLLIRFRTDVMEEFFTAIGISKMQAADYAI